MHKLCLQRKKEMTKKFNEFYSPVIYKKLSPKMKDAVDDIFKKMDSKPSDFLNTFDKTITAISKRYRVREKDLISYFEKEMLAI